MIKREFECNVCGNQQRGMFKIVAVAGTAFDYNKEANKMEFGICSVAKCQRCNNYSTVFRKTADVKIEEVEKFSIDKKSRKRVFGKRISELVGRIQK